MSVMALNSTLPGILVAGMSQYAGECAGCWDEMAARVHKLGLDSPSSSYRHKGNSVLLNSVDPTGQLDESYGHRLFRRSGAQSEDFECDACWVVLTRLRSFDSNRQEKRFLNMGPLVKKAMLNNGWV